VVRRGDDACFGALRLLAAQRQELALLEDTQQRGLEGRTGVTDLVEQQRAAAGQRETAASVRDRAGERAANVAEELRFQETVRQRRAVDGDERLSGERGVVVDRSGHALLARAGLAQQQHVHATRCHLARACRPRSSAGAGRSGTGHVRR
jgi:hypothetical protein